MKNLLQFLIFTCLLLSSAFAGPSTIIISEVLFDAQTPESAKEWIEIYNPTQNIINIGGFELHDNSGAYTIATGTQLNPNQVMVFARSISGFQAEHGFTPDFGNLTLSLANGGDQVSLQDASARVIDFVSWKNYVPGWDLTAGNGQSIQRISLGYTSQDWISGQTPNPGNPAPIESNAVPEPSSILLLGLGLCAFAIYQKKRK